MFRNIKISLKIVALVLVMTAIAVATVAIGAYRMDTGPLADARLRVILYSGGAVCVFAVVVAIRIAAGLTAPLDAVHFLLRMVSKGELPEKSGKRFTDEFGKIQERVDDLVEMLKGNARFAQKVGEGKFDTAFRPAGENDSLGIALMDMRDNLVANDRKEREHNWIVLGLAEAGEILRTHDNLDALGDEIIRFTIGKVDAIQGAFYVVKDRQIELCNSFAYNRRKYLRKNLCIRRRTCRAGGCRKGHGASHRDTHRLHDRLLGYPGRQKTFMHPHHAADHQRGSLWCDRVGRF